MMATMRNRRTIIVIVACHAISEDNRNYSKGNNSTNIFKIS